MGMLIDENGKLVPDNDSSEKLFPSSPKEENICRRRQLWLTFIRKSSTFLWLAAKLQSEFDKIQKKPDEERSESEKFVGSLKCVADLEYQFCDSMARICEQISENLKTTHRIEGELVDSIMFVSPNNLFIPWLLDAFDLYDEGGEIVNGATS